MSVFSEHPLPWRVERHNTDTNPWRHYCDVVDSNGGLVIQATDLKCMDATDIVELTAEELIDLLDVINHDCERIEQLEAK